MGSTPEWGAAFLPPGKSRWGMITCTPATVGTTQRQMCVLSANVRNPTLAAGKLGSDREDRVQNEQEPREAGAESRAKSHPGLWAGPTPTGLRGLWLPPVHAALPGEVEFDSPFA